MFFAENIVNKISILVFLYKMPGKGGGGKGGLLLYLGVMTFVDTRCRKPVKKDRNFIYF